MLSRSIREAFFNKKSGLAFLSIAVSNTVHISSHYVLRYV